MFLNSKNSFKNLKKEKISKNVKKLIQKSNQYEERNNERYIKKRTNIFM